MYLEFFYRESLWDRPPIGYETLTPMQYKAMRGTCLLIIKIFIIYITVIYWHCLSILQTIGVMHVVRTLFSLFEFLLFLFQCFPLLIDNSCRPDTSQCRRPSSRWNSEQFTTRQSDDTSGSSIVCWKYSVWNN